MKKVLVFGGSGLVGSRFVKLNTDQFDISAPQSQEVDILNKDQVTKLIQDFNPDIVINFAAFTNVENAENQKGDREGICFLINAIGAKNVASVCGQFEKKLIHISTEYVFDGTKADSPYTEDDKPNPINWYGATKLFGEEFVLESGCLVAIVRISMPFSDFYQEKKDIARFFLEQLKNKTQVTAVEDQRITPTYVDYIADALKILIEEGSSGIYHISSTDSVTPVEFVKTIAEVFKLDYSLISGISLDEYNEGKKAKLLKFSWLNPTKFERQFGDEVLHTVEEGLIFFKEAVDSKVRDQI